MRLPAPARERGPVPDAEPPRVGADLGAEPAIGPRRGVRVTDTGTRGGVEYRRGVAHRPGEDVLVGRHRPVLAEVGTEGGATPAGLEADEAAHRGRDPHGSA